MQKFDFNDILTFDDAIASRGAIPLVEGGKLIGAIGCWGGAGSQDKAARRPPLAQSNRCAVTSPQAHVRLF
jgi:uncharacterized protein GlcG (DUF336 family)